MHEIKTSAPTKKLHTKRQNLHRGLYAFQKDEGRNTYRNNNKVRFSELVAKTTFMKTTGLHYFIYWVYQRTDKSLKKSIKYSIVS